MKISKTKPSITRIIYRQDREDPNYGSCLWAYFDFDPDKGLLNIQSDCGNYAHRWPETGDDFWKLCAGLNGDYLIGKLCGKPREVDEEATIETVREYLEDAEYYEDEQKNRRKINRALDELEILFSDHNVEDAVGLAQYLLDGWNSDYDMQMDCVWELVETKYSAHQERIVKIYVNYIRPEIVRMIQEKNSCKEK